MGKKWTDDEVKAEIAAAVAIVREDRERASYAQLHSKYGQSPSDDSGNSSGDGPPAPPKKEEGDGDLEEGKPKSSLWWGDRLEDD